VSTSALVAWAMAGTIVVLLVVIWSIKRHRDPRLRVECDAGIAELMPTLAGLTLGHAVAGNAIEVHENGAYFDALLAEMGAARRSLHFETYLWKDGVLARRVADVLAERARAGVAVRVLLDASGGRRMGREVECRLGEAGCRLQWFHPFDWRHLGVLNERTHRKMAIVDGRTAFVGGHCITDDWLGDAEDHRHFADLSIRLTGPAVAGVQAAFAENWIGRTGEMFAGDDVFPPLAPTGTASVHVAYVKPEGSAPAVKLLHHAAICFARERLWIQNPYFIPETEAVDALAEAVARGVDVRVLVPAVGGSDNPMVQHAGHWLFERLLRGGVRIFEYPHTLLHQKVMTIDGAWCAIGSSNFDDRSFETNDEITLGVLDAATTRRLDAVFEKYAARATELRLEQWRRRGLGLRLKEGAAYLVNEVL
jgi:cardiolipin synthase